MVQTSSRILLQAAAILLALPCLSCEKGKPCFPVQGQVFVGGSPAAGAQVILFPENDPDPQALKPAGIVEADGSFMLRTYDPRLSNVQDGAPAGRYVVTISWQPENAKELAVSNPNAPDFDKLHGRYSDPKASRLRAEVKEGPNDLPAFQLPKTDLDRPKK